MLDYDYSMTQSDYNFLDVECFPSDSELLINPLENKHKFKKEPGPFLRIQSFRRSPMI